MKKSEVPDLLRVLLDRAVRGEDAGSGDIGEGHLREARPVLIDLDCALLCGLVAFKVSDRHIAVGSAEARREQGCRHIVKPLAKRAGGKHLQHPVKLGRQELVRVIAPLPQRLHLVSGHAEEEHIVVTDPVADLDVRAVERAEGDRAVDHELHVARAGYKFRRPKYIPG